MTTDERLSGQRFAILAMFLFVKCVIQVDTFKGGGRASYRGGIGGRQGRQHYSRHKKGSNKITINYFPCTSSDQNLCHSGPITSLSWQRQSRRHKKTKNHI